MQDYPWARGLAKGNKTGGEMKQVELILKRILERAKQISRLREENAKDREIIAEFEGRKPELE